MCEALCSSADFVEYRESYAVAEGASQVIDELEIHLDGGSAEIVWPALVSRQLV